MSQPERFRKELGTAIRIAKEAGKILLGQFAHPADIEEKQDGTLVSRADREAAQFITARLQRRFPDQAILNEELRDDGSRFQRRLCWVVDPLDGTTEFLNRGDDFGVLLGLLADFQPVLGVTFKPLRGRQRRHPRNGHPPNRCVSGVAGSFVEPGADSPAAYGAR